VREIAISQDAATLVEKEFVGLHSGGGRSTIMGGQSAADKALESLDISGYAKTRSEVLPSRDLHFHVKEITRVGTSLNGSGELNSQYV